MINNKYDNISLIPAIIIIFFSFLFLSIKVYNLIIKTTANSIIQSIKEDYSARAKVGENLNIDSLLIGYQSSTINMYQKHLQSFTSKYQYFDFFKQKIDKQIFPENFNEFNRNNFLNLVNNFDIKNDLNLQGFQLKIAGKINSIKNPNLSSTGDWAIYFNDQLKYSSVLILNEEKNQSFGTHVYKYRFNEKKEIYLRVVYSFYENETTIKYLVFENLINIKNR